MNTRPWWPPAVAGAVTGALAWLLWYALDSYGSGCADGFCQVLFAVPAWSSGPPLIGLVGWALVAVIRLINGSGIGSGPSVVIAAVGTTAGYLGVRLFDAFEYGTPRAPLAVLIACGVVGYLLGAAITDGGRRLRIGAIAVAGALLVTTVVGELTSPGRDRLHRFTTLRSILRIPDQSRYRIVSADAYLRYHAVRLELRAVTNGSSLELFEIPTPTTWNPPTGCGPALTELSVAVLANTTVVDSACVAYPDGGWQRTYPTGRVELIDVQSRTLAMVAPFGVNATAPASELRDVLTSLKPATPASLAHLPAG